MYPPGSSFSLSQIFYSSFKYTLNLCKINTTFYYYKTLAKKRKVSGGFSTKYFPSIVTVQAS